MRRLWLGAVSPAVAVGLLFAGCAAKRPPTPHLAPAVLPSARDLDAALRTRRDTLRSLRALARLRYQAPDDTSTSREAIVVARPDRLRVEVLSVFGSVFVLTADNGELRAYARQERTVYRGSASPQNLWRYAHLGLPLTDLVALVLGTPPPTRAAHQEVGFDPETGWIRLRQQLDGGAQIVWFSDTALPVAAEQRGDDGEVQWQATFSDYEVRDGVPVATRVGIEWPAGRGSLQIALDQIDVNPTLDNSIFALQAPPGSKVVDLDPVAD
jgi:hypothetical protein